MAGYYTVKQGDHVSSIASANGFADYHIVWDHPKNADLKQKRQNPNVLFPGDPLFIPDREERIEPCSTDQRHNFQTKKFQLRLRLVLEDLYEKPIANTPCDLLLREGARHLTTDGAGKIDEIIPADTHDAMLLIKGPATPFQDDQIPIRVGHLDPVDKPSGQAARLTNLGYYFAALGSAGQGRVRLGRRRIPVRPWPPRGRKMRSSHASQTEEGARLLSFAHGLRARGSGTGRPA